ncbi:MAG TPA: NADP-dependent oxidoreductase [Polyangia bacterium]|jgi:NADPH:quinone reductase-like Zn-dependent oxidoreductase|nr:NADP-dependent oxidoreductase [Polyangia bacterium]
MKAVVLATFGQAERLELRDVAEPTPGRDEIKVRVVAAGINPIDWKLRSGALQPYMPIELPAVLGRDVAGEVVAVGAGVTRFRVGARVCGLVRHGYAEYVVAPEDNFAAVPMNLDLVEAAALPLVLLTGTQLVEAAVDVHAGESVLVTGATGGVGRVAVYVAKRRGGIVYAAVRAAHQVEAAKLGVHGVVALDDERQVETLPELDALADTVGGPTTQKLLPKLKRAGRIGSVVGEPPGAKELGLVVRAFMAHPDAKRLEELVNDVAAGTLVIPILRKFPLREAAQAHQLAENGGAGKVLLTT